MAGIYQIAMCSMSGSTHSDKLGRVVSISAASLNFMEFYSEFELIVWLLQLYSLVHVHVIFGGSRQLLL